MAGLVFLIGPRRSVPEHAAHHAADQAAHEGAGIAAAAAIAATSATTAAAVPHVAAAVGGGIVGRGLAGRDDLGQQRLVLELVEIAADRIAAGGLPALDHRAGVIVELPGDLGVEAEAVEPALHVAALPAVEPDLVLGDLARLLAEGCGIDGGQIARHILAVLVLPGRAVIERRDPRQRQRAELAVGIA